MQTTLHMLIQFPKGARRAAVLRIGTRDFCWEYAMALSSVRDRHSSTPKLLSAECMRHAGYMLIRADRLAEVENRHA